MTAIYIIADIEGSSGCNERTDAQLFNDGWEIGRASCRERVWTVV